MKKTLTIFLSLLVMVGCAGAPAGTATPVPEHTAAIDGAETAKIAVDRLIAGEYDAVAQAVHPDLQDQITADILRSAWEPIASAIGEYRGEVSFEQVNGEGYASVTDIRAFDGGNVRFTVTVDAQGSIIGFYLKDEPSQAPLKSTDAYSEHAVTVGEYGLYGVLTLPSGVDKPPVAVLIQGSGSSDLNESAYALAPFRDIAHGLAEHGIATLRFNKRTYEHPDAALTDATIEYEVLNDASAAIAMMEADHRVGDVYLIGHSLGGMLAPKIAEDNSGLCGFISLAGTPAPLEDVIYAQNEAAIASYQSGTPEEKASALSLVAEETAKVKGFTEEDAADVSVTAFGIPAAYWVSLNAIDTPAITRRLAIPMLFMRGEADFQVTAELFYLWRDCTHDEYAEFVTYPGLNHFFMESTTGDAEEYNTAAYVDSGVIQDMADWIKKHSPTEKKTEE